ncbi:hypothetical protein [Providencia stuartii]|uniref:hypothetical protein n=1 Tax=Providencia stuartii TaxID=588 RepID=UPI000E01AE77|nr:hypothetical protein [Providencia stuartii]EJD6044043.1 hypothetical protein [Providencia rettgeri]ELR5238309.1 hypothetical protein [Providencia rettgeri]ELR5245606.1 hypothetical protein [Providencia rettgeri]ELR5261180.1 hypothetical protein [Providencia rettgeri]MDK3008138.1 hypothetical protein [Providencia rettgeri]
MSVDYFLLDDDGSFKIYTRDVMLESITIREDEIQPEKTVFPHNQYSIILFRIDEKLYPVMDTMSFNSLDYEIKKRLILESGCRHI